jgi:hypothetical protein
LHLELLRKKRTGGSTLEDRLFCGPRRVPSSAPAAILFDLPMMATTGVKSLAPGAKTRMFRAGFTSSLRMIAAPGVARSTSTLVSVDPLEQA